MIKKIAIDILILLLAFLPCYASAATSFGIGAGIPYGGVLGVNIDYTLTKNLDLTIGYGETIFAGTGKAIGLRYYPNPSESKLRYSLIYGTNAIIQDSDCALFIFCDDNSSYEGFNLSVGWGSRDEKRGWDFDFILILTSDAWDEIEKLRKAGDSIKNNTDPRLTISFGYHW
jgi:hypothetical protein